MNRKSRPTNLDHTRHRAFISMVREGRRSWTATTWQYCPECRVMMPDG